MQIQRRLFWMTAALFLPLGATAAQATISKGGITVTIDRSGLLERVPATGLRTLDGPEVVLTPSTPEWFGISFNQNGRHVEGVGLGAQPDWADGRVVVQPVAFAATAGEVDAITRVGDMEIHTRFYFDDTQPFLLASVTMTNVGPSILKDILYTREWGGGETWSFPLDMPSPQPLETGIRRRCWMFGDMEPGRTVGAGFSYVLPKDMPGGGGGPAPLAAVDVPLSLWTSPTWPSGLVIGNTAGISFGDYDADGFTDLFALWGGSLIRNLGGNDWQVVADLKALLPPTTYRYGSSFGDYDNDGLPDIGCEPRACCGGDTCHHLFRNLGGGPNFMDVATNPAIMDVQACGADAETIIWGDVDGDANLDMFLPVYPSFVSGGPGNFFWHNQGPTGPGGAYRFLEKIGPSGLDNPPGTARPEGAMFLDTDFDGDAEIYSNGTLYRNVSTPGTPLFNPMTTAGSGIKYSNSLEEGIVFHDIDLDGDLDFTGVWSSGAIGVRVFEALGDGVYSELPTSTVDSYTTGLDLGISTEDWDNDGDMDLTTRQIFRRNQYVETGVVKFTVATHTIPAGHLTSATPAWGDWDRDGDLDCGLGNWTSIGHFYENTSYGTDTPDDRRRYVRLRIVRDSATVPRGLETEYGAYGEIHVVGETDVRRRKLVSSSGGYLNQDEYSLHFAVPADPVPLDPAADLTFDVSVDLAGPPQDGFLRIDKHVNPVLGDVKLAQLVDREIVVFRSGKVQMDGCTYDPLPARSIVHRTSTDGLIRALPTTTIPAPAPAGSNTFVGLEFHTLGAAGPLRINEILVDGQLDSPTACTDPTNIALWDVTSPGAPFLVSNGALIETTRPNNRRSYFRTNIVVDPGRVYRMVARVTSQRSTSIVGPVATGGVTVTGGIAFVDTTPCAGGILPFVTPDPTRVYLAFRFSEDPIDPFTNFGGGAPGTSGIPVLAGTGSLQVGAPTTLSVSSALPGAPAALAIGFTADCQTILGTQVLPALDVIVGGLAITGGGTLSLTPAWPALPPGTSLYFQTAVIDAGAFGGVAFSNGIAGTTQP
jgi:hypothetical protein